MKLILICSLLTWSLVASDDTWESYKANHGKKYNAAEEAVRRAHYEKAHADITAHNRKFKAGKESYMKGHNKFSDMTAEEKRAVLGFKPQSSHRQDKVSTVDDSATDRALPTSYDLRTSKCMPAIKNQGNCGDCWAFATTTPIEYQHCVKHGNSSVLLSEQQITDCTYSSDGCQGGDHHDAWSYLYSAGGQESAAAYPFVSASSGVATTCKFSASKVTAKLVNAGTDIAQNEASIQSALVANGPITFAFCVSDNFFFYTSGVFSDSTCQTDYASLNHEMVIVGYGVSGSTPYWIIRNQWGTGWGLSGYALVLRNKNTCGIAVEAGYPTVV